MKAEVRIASGAHCLPGTFRLQVKVEVTIGSLWPILRGINLAEFGEECDYGK